MPLYEYYCPDCDIRCEQHQPYQFAAALPACPSCQAPMPRVFGFSVGTGLIHNDTYKQDRRAKWARR